MSIQPAQPAERLPNLPLGKEWIARFIKRHKTLQVQFGRRIESQRMDGATEPVIQAWFDAYKEVVKELGIEEKNTYNMDESGYSIGTLESTCIIVDSTCRTRYQAHASRQEWISAVECICADGSDNVPPFLIFKGQNIQRSWIPPAILHQWYFSANSKGWTSNLHRIEWLKCVFEPATREKAAGQQRLLICNGHNSHIGRGFISHCIQNQISLLILPPHTLHLLQPLDVAILAR